MHLALVAAHLAEHATAGHVRDASRAVAPGGRDQRAIRGECRTPHAFAGVQFHAVQALPRRPFPKQQRSARQPGGEPRAVRRKCQAEAHAGLLRRSVQHFAGDAESRAGPAPEMSVPHSADERGAVRREHPPVAGAGNFPFRAIGQGTQHRIHRRGGGQTPRRAAGEPFFIRRNRPPRRGPLHHQLRRRVTAALPAPRGKFPAENHGAVGQRQHRIQRRRLRHACQDRGLLRLPPPHRALQPRAEQRAVGAEACPPHLPRVPRQPAMRIRRQFRHQPVPCEAAQVRCPCGGQIGGQQFAGMVGIRMVHGALRAGHVGGVEIEPQGVRRLPRLVRGRVLQRRHVLRAARLTGLPCQRGGGESAGGDEREAGAFHPPQPAFRAAQAQHILAGMNEHQLCPQVARICKAPRRPGLAAPQQHRIERSPGRRFLLVRKIPRHVREIEPVPPGTQLIQHQSQRISIRRRSPRPFARHIALRAHIGTVPAAPRHQPHVRQLGQAAHENDIRRLDVAMHQPRLMQMRQRRRQPRAKVRRLPHREPSAAPRRVLLQCQRHIFRARPIRRVRQLHHIIKAPRRVIPPDLQNIHQPLVTARHRLIPLQTLELPLIGSLMLEMTPAQNLRRPPRPDDTFHQPDLTVRAHPDPAHQPVLSDRQGAMNVGRHLNSRREDAHPRPDCDDKSARPPFLRF